MQCSYLVKISFIFKKRKTISKNGFNKMFKYFKMSLNHKIKKNCFVITYK